MEIGTKNQENNEIGVEFDELIDNDDLDEILDPNSDIQEKYRKINKIKE